MTYRTPKNYDGIRSSAKTLGDLLPEWMGHFAGRHNSRPCDLIASWPEIAGETIAKWTKAVSFTDGVLTVLVRSSTLYGVLSQHEKPQILARLKERFAKSSVRDIHFRVG